MANLDAPFGLRAITSRAGTVPQIHEYVADAGGNNIYAGSFVRIIAGSGSDAEVVDGVASDTAPGLSLIGVAVHARLTTDTERTVLVYDDPDQEYEIQQDSDTSNLESASDFVGTRFTVVNGQDGSLTTRQSIMELDSTSGATTDDGTLPLIGLRFARDAENDITSNNSRLVVKICDINHIYRRGTAV